MVRNPPCPCPCPSSSGSWLSSGAASRRSETSAPRRSPAEPPSRAASSGRGGARGSRVRRITALGLDDGLEGPVPLPLVAGLARGLPLDVGDVGLDLGERGVAALTPVLQGGDDAGHRPGLDVPQRRDGGHLDDGAEGVQLGVEEARVDGGDDQVLDLAERGQAEVLLQGVVGEVPPVAAKGEEGELAELEPLAVV